jgi:hypothetical protein
MDPQLGVSMLGEQSGASWRGGSASSRGGAARGDCTSKTFRRTFSSSSSRSLTRAQTWPPG